MDAPEKVFDRLVDALEINDATQICDMLIGLCNWPSGDLRVLPYLEKLLEDKRICLILYPPTFGEVAYLAAFALCAERHKIGISTRIQVTVSRPIRDVEVFSIAEQNNIEVKYKREEVIPLMEKFIAMGKIQQIEFDIDPVTTKGTAYKFIGWR